MFEYYIHYSLQQSLFGGVKMAEIKTIGVLTSGGDAPGMNAAIRAVVRSAIVQGIRVLGIRRGYNGLINGDMLEMNLRSVSDIIHRGGTMLYTARCLEFKTHEGMQKAVQTCKDVGIDGMVVIGGDGSFRGAADLSSLGIPTIGIPGTIDNDIGASDYTIGFDTSINTVMENVDRLRDTAQSHDRCSVVEVMGRKAGFIALHAGIAVGATSIIVNEVPFDIERDIILRMNNTSKTGKKHFIIVISEGVGRIDEFAQIIEERTGIETKTTKLGHVQRGGSPTVRDRVMASEMGYHAVKLLLKGIGNRVVVFRDNKITDLDIHEALSITKLFETDLFNIAHTISI
jgi:6-phosphofructokinase 1